MTGEGGLPKMTSVFTTIFGLIFASFTTKFESEFQKYINFHKRAISELKRIRDRSYLT